MKSSDIFSAFAGTYVLLVAVSGLELGDECRTPQGKRGTCISIRNCPVLYTELKEHPLPPNTLGLLQKSLCGFIGVDPLACCPSSSEGIFTSRPPSEIDDTKDVSEHKNIDLLGQQKCGLLSEVNIRRGIGNKSVPFEFPWMALISYSVPSGSPFKCAGSIINNHYVLTAAHCVKFLPNNLRPISVRLGEVNLDTEIDCTEYFDHNLRVSICAPAPENIDIEEIIPHPNYIGRPNFENDIALLRLSRAANFGLGSVNSICLPIGLTPQTENLEGKPLVISGWTITNNLSPSPFLLKANIPGISFEECNTAYEGVASVSPISQVCAGGTRAGTCLGDAGGPLVSYKTVHGRTRAVQQGIMSFSHRSCDAPGKPAVYTRVGNYMKWILDTIKP